MRTRATLVATLAVLVLAGCGGGDDEMASACGEGAVDKAELGMCVKAAEGWENRGEGDEIDLRSPSESISISLTSPTAGKQPKAVKEGARQQLEESLTETRILEDGEAPLGNRTATGFILQGRLNGAPVLVASVVEDTDKRTYLLRTFIQNGATEKEQRDLKAIVGSIRLTEPKT